MKFKSFFSAFLILTISLHGLNAGEVRFFDNNQMTSHMLTSLCQDKEGYVWIGTEYGLNRFDGMVFTHYYTYNNTLVDNYIHDLFVDDHGDMLVISGRTLQMYDRTSDTFRNVSFPEGHVPVLSDIVQMSDGTLIVSNSKRGLWRVDKSSMTASLMPDVSSCLGECEVQALYRDSKERLWICTNNDGLFIYDYPNGRVEHLLLPGNSETLRGVSGVTEYKDGRLIVLGLSDVYSYNEQTKQLDVLFTYDHTISVRRLYQSADGTLYTGSYMNSLRKVDLQAGKMLPVHEDIVEEYNLSDAGLYSFLEDADGNQWFGFSRKGLVLITRRPMPFRYISLEDIRPKGNGALTSFYAIDHGMFYLGQSREGLHVLDSAFRVRRSYLSGTSPMAVCQVSKSKLWVGDYAKGACLLDMNTGAAEWYVKDKRVMDFARDAEGNVYMAVFNGPLVSFTADGSEQRELGVATGGLHLHGRYLNTLYSDSKGLLWIGHHYGFDVYDPAADQILDIAVHPQLRKSIVYDITETPDGTIWFGTSLGLFGYEASSNEWIHRSASDGMLCDIVCSIIVADDASLWLSTYRGLLHYVIDEDRFSSYLQGDGLQESSYVRRVATSSSGGKFYFGNDMGITSFYPDEVSSDAFKRPLKSVALLLGQKQVEIKDNKVILPHNQSSFTLRFSTMDFRNPQNLSFEYQLSSSKDNEWRRTPMGYGEVNFYNLDYGDHVVSVRAVYNDTCSEVENIYIRITPPWYLTLLAKICYCLLAALMVLFIWLFWYHRKVAEMNEEKVRLFIDISHEIRSPLTLIKSPLESLISRSYDEHTSKALRAIQRNTDRLLLLTNQILSIRKIEKGQMKMHYAETQIQAFVRDYVQDYEYSASKRGVCLTVECPAEPLVAWIDREHFGKIVSNLVSNALKYVEDGGCITVSVRSGADRKARGPLADYIEICVADNGNGIDEQHLKHVFERFYQVTSAKASSQLGFGIGLNLSSQLVRLHGGIITAHNRKDCAGSEFIVRIPAGNSHLPADQLVGDDYYVRTQEHIEVASADDTIKSRSYKRKKTDFKVVVVDDDEEIRNFLKEEFSATYYVSVYSDGREALEAVAENVPDLIISDVTMPQMDGLTLLKRLKNNTATSHVPVILLTSKVAHESRIEGYEHGADAYLDKPFNIEELMTIAASLIANRGRMRGKLSGAQEQKGVLKPVELKGNDAALMERIMASINRRLCDPDFNVEALADDVGLSRVQLHRRVKEMTGITVGEFLRNLRMKQAAELLAKGDVSVSQVTYAVGMSNPTHFTTAFKKYYGVTPSEYLARHK